MARFGMNRRSEDDVVETSLVEGGVATEDVIDAQMAQTDMDELTALNDDLIEFSQSADGLAELQSAHDVQVQVMDGALDPTTGRVEDDVNISVDAKDIAEAGEIAGPEGEILTQDASEGDAEAAAVKLENDIQALLTPLNGTYRSSRYAASSVLSRTQENALNNLTGKAKYRRTVEGIGDVAKKVWEYIKDFFKKIWAKIKDLASRFMGLFRSNKSILENLKKDIDADDAANYETCDKEKVGQALRILCVDPYQDASAWTAGFETIKKDSEDMIEKFEKGDFGKVMNADLSKMGKDTIKDIEGLDKKARYEAIGVTSEGMLLMEFKGDNVNNFTMGVVTKKVKKEEFSKVSDKKGCLIDICDNGIQLCEALEGDTFKDLEKAMSTFEKDVEKAIKEALDEKKDKLKDAGVEAQSAHGNEARIIQRLVPKLVSGLVQTVVAVSKAPSAYVAAVRNGKSICHKK